ncbi:MAG: hypothetical protein JO142_02990 [Burkholderiales bacterium]|nr:hypothetical protein [Burkholderiales bacterium]
MPSILDIDPKTVVAKIQAGELPSKVLRGILDRFPDATKNDAGQVLNEAFPNMWLIECVWAWKASKQSTAIDTQFDLRVIGRMIEAGADIPWDISYCDAEQLRIRQALIDDAAEELRLARDAVSYESLYDKAKRLDSEILCIEALWDGDTTGWHVVLSAVVRESDNVVTKWLGTVKFGGDIRLFNGAVSPWPEAMHAKEVGSKLADEFKASFYFPSPDEPNDALPNWIEFGGRSI